MKNTITSQFESVPVGGAFYILGVPRIGVKKYLKVSDDEARLVSIKPYKNNPDEGDSEFIPIELVSHEFFPLNRTVLIGKDN